MLGLSEGSDDHVDYVCCKDHSADNEEDISKHVLGLLRLNKVSKNDQGVSNQCKQHFDTYFQKVEILL